MEFLYITQFTKFQWLYEFSNVNCFVYDSGVNSNLNEM